MSTPKPKTEAPCVVVMHGDQTGEELPAQTLRGCTPDVIGFEMDLDHHDLSLENRRQSKNQIVHQTAMAMPESGLALKVAAELGTTAFAVAMIIRVKNKLEVWAPLY